MRVNALLQRINAINNLSAQLNGALACGKGSEFGITSYRVATLAALKSVIQNEIAPLLVMRTPKPGISASY